MNANISPFCPSARVTGDPDSSREQTAIAVNVASRRSDRAMSAEAVALEADAVIAWHDETRGHAGAILKSRADSYAREQGLGLKPLTVGDLCEAILVGGREGRCAARAVIEILSRAVEPAVIPDKALPAALGDYVREHADVTQAYLNGGSPAQILRELAEADGATLSLRKAVIAAGSAK